jgi:hypothetical protein
MSITDDIDFASLPNVQDLIMYLTEFQRNNRGKINPDTAITVVDIETNKYIENTNALKNAIELNNTVKQNFILWVKNKILDNSIGMGVMWSHNPTYCRTNYEMNRLFPNNYQQSPFQSPWYGFSPPNFFFTNINNNVNNRLLDINNATNQLYNSTTYSQISLDSRNNSQTANDSAANTRQITNVATIRTIKNTRNVAGNLPTVLHLDSNQDNDMTSLSTRTQTSSNQSCNNNSTRQMEHLSIFDLTLTSSNFDVYITEFNKHFECEQGSNILLKKIADQETIDVNFLVHAKINCVPMRNDLQSRWLRTKVTTIIFIKYFPRKKTITCKLLLIIFEESLTLM